MRNELLALFDYYEKEKGIKRHTMVEALETALLSAARKTIGPARDLEVKIEPEKGDIRVFANLLVKDRVNNPYEEIDIFTARRLKPDLNVDDEIKVDITPGNFGRIAAQTAKQTMLQRLRMAEKELIYEEYKDRAGDIVSGTVRRFERGDVFIDLGKFEGIMRQRDRVVTEEYNVGDRIRAYVVAVENGARGPEIILSRSHVNFVRRLFESEVSEIADHTVEIRSLAREAGYRTKVAVYSADEKVDPVGACVGLRGARVKNIVRELNNEKVDIIRWSEDIRTFVIDALKPAEIKTITLDEATRSVRVTVDEEELSKAIGRRGQNARLTARLIGWEVQVQKDESAHEVFEARVATAGKEISKISGIDLETAVALVRGGFPTVETIANDADEVDIAGILDIDVSDALAILNQARAVIGLEPSKGTSHTLVDKESAEGAPENTFLPAEEETYLESEEGGSSLEDDEAPQLVAAVGGDETEATVAE